VHLHSKPIYESVKPNGRSNRLTRDVSAEEKERQLGALIALTSVPAEAACRDCAEITGLSSSEVGEQGEESVKGRKRALLEKLLRSAM